VPLAPGLLVHGLRPRDRYALDGVLALALTVACGLAAVEAPQSGGWPEPGWVTLLTAGLIGSPAALRRRRPLPTLAISLAVSAAALTSGIIPDYACAPVVAVLACELHAVGSEVTAGSLPTLAVTLAVLASAVLLSPGDQGSLLGTAFAGLVVAAAWMLGRIRRERRLHAAQVAEQRTQRAVGDERLRIARELHDIVAHSMSLIAVRAGVAGHVFDARPLEARAALHDIEAASRSALNQLRQAIGVLRGEGGSYAPAPGLADLPLLAAGTTAGGVPVRLTLSGEELISEVPEAVALSAFRIVQEAFTNAVKHATPAACAATVTVTTSEIRIRVANDGVLPPAPGGGGHGLIGMRERVAAWGGEFSAGPGPDDDFVVTATLPYRGAAS
jgi:signal transduction histidine kinase